MEAQKDCNINIRAKVSVFGLKELNDPFSYLCHQVQHIWPGGGS
jgi:hypothetical protein